ncbi:Uncharacterised protein [Vibrio cholerae]|nr:Uncharacterised protein [Vibrio cholerae]CSB26002.1 Uncharacterised protein [Vibrio cholerae]CSB84496.1 Uncharacterised protein [Vibrio cholerae]CSC64493.1 Uncharacterised protein [Vibrio cholerae]CSC87901.1 Uncharacterised protein [Vibrio cholerae]
MLRCSVLDLDSRLNHGASNEQKRMFYSLLVPKVSKILPNHPYYCLNFKQLLL